MSNFHDLVPVFKPTVLIAMDLFGAERHEINTIDELSNAIYSESNEWFGRDKADECKEQLIIHYNLHIEMYDETERALSLFHMGDSTYKFVKP